MKLILSFVFLLSSLGLNAQSTLEHTFSIVSEAPLNPSEQEALKTSILNRIKWLELDSIDVSVFAEEVYIDTKSSLSEKDRIALVTSLQSTNQVEFWHVLKNTAPLIVQIPKSTFAIEGFNSYLTFMDNSFPEEAIGTCSDPKKLDKISRKIQESASKKDQITWLWSTKAQFEGKDAYFLYALKTENNKQNLINNEHIYHVNPILNANPHSFHLTINLNRIGAQNWAKMTDKATMEKGYLAISLNKRVLSTPRIYQPILSGIIPLQEIYNKQEAEYLAQEMAMGRILYGLQLVGVQAKK